MKDYCNPYAWGALSPIKATPDMTHEVGQRDGKLFTKPTGGIPDIATSQNGDILEIVGGVPAWSGTLRTSLTTMREMQTEISILQAQMDDVISGLVELAMVQREILGGVV